MTRPRARRAPGRRRVRAHAGLAVAAGLAALVGALLLTLGGGGAGAERTPATASGTARLGETGTVSGTTSPAQTVSLDCPAPSLGGSLPAVVYLPAGYSASGPALPVVYFLHGLPADPDTYLKYGFVAGALAATGERAIVVAPQGARDPSADREYLDWSPHEDWPKAISDDLTSCIDARYDTIRARSGRALVGLSAGGYGAFNIGLRNLRTFGAVEAWSGYFVATDPSGHQILHLASAAQRAAAIVPRGAALAAALRRDPALIAFYVGSGDSRFARDNATFAARLASSGIPHLYDTYPGGHDEALWSAHAGAWLRTALVYLATGRTVAP